MTNDYLWDRSGPPDPDIERLERMLGRLRSEPPLPDLSTLRPGRQPIYVGARFLAPALAAAAGIALMIGITSRTPPQVRGWEIAPISGTPRVDARPLARERRLAVGQTIVTDEASSARIAVSTIGEVTVGSNSRVRLAETREAHHRLALERGSLHAIISAPPGQFVVDTPSATATDLGCVYTLRVDEGGAGLLSVGAGWVAFEDKRRESFVPAGASSRMDTARGPGTPTYDDASDTFHDAVDAVDFSRTDGERREALHAVLQSARARDAITLWHLVTRVAPADRAAVVDALGKLSPMPASVSRDSVLRLDADALDRWWDALGLGDTAWWRTWNRPMSEIAPR